MNLAQQLLKLQAKVRGIAESVVVAAAAATESAKAGSLRQQQQQLPQHKESVLSVQQAVATGLKSFKSVNAAARNACA